MKNRIVVGVCAVALVFTACGRERDTTTDDLSVTGGLGQTLAIPAATEWVATGISMEPGLRAEVQVSQDQMPLGDIKVDNLATIPTFGLHGVIGKIGIEGLPFVIGERYEVQGSSLTQGEQLYVGRNLAPTDPFADQLTAPADDTATTELIQPAYTAHEYIVQVRTYASNSPALLTPVDGFYDATPNPVFDWDDQNNAAQYSLDISRFKDFRSILFNVNIASTSLNSALLGLDPTDPLGGTTSPNLTEGVYYWRVRGQINTGRTLSPNLEWTDRSVAHRLGVELEQAVPAPTVLTPSGPVALDDGQFLTMEFLAQPDASGLVWRYGMHTAACGTTINPDTESPVRQSVWFAFQSDYRGNDIGQVPPLYGFFRTASLTQGEWLVRIETRDGKDRNALRTGIADYRFSVGCN